MPRKSFDEVLKYTEYALDIIQEKLRRWRKDAFIKETRTT